MWVDWIIKIDHLNRNIVASLGESQNYTKRKQEIKKFSTEKYMRFSLLNTFNYKVNFQGPLGQI